MDERTGVFGRDTPYLDREIEIGVADGRLLSVTFPDTAGDRDGSEHPLLDRIEAVLGGEDDDLRDVEVALTMPTDRRRVLDALRSVPRGETVSLAQLARMTADLDPDADDAARTVASALRDNPVPIVVPSHRVSDGPDAAPATVASALRRVEGL
ncbi:MGMT family protein [Halococcoides cellulosivorans]|uniref:Methylated-DNA--protein-cysteine methyltransferase n=1 Tax=Halococcoides cellulosivorans TaxID=1679096 RepID=A0A2R4X0H4_9EURY|nr:MGMT family protein [Halococcoides cellulosivorans]AWB27261.1 cysteine methyltransferase [Halococcoides cellulosivorans]